MGRPPAYEDAYPQTLWEHERAHLRARMPERHRGLEDRPSDQVVGVALSGGGIRSATFCLGVFQALAELRRLSGIDYLSTVSGGGYFGTFLGRLYRRDEVENDEQVRAMLDPKAPSSARGGKVPDVVGWLRENGRYLSPNGAGDLLIAAAIMLRNWVTIQVVLLSFVLLVMLVAQLPRVALEVSWCPSLVMCPADGWLWWSPWRYVPGLTVAFWAVPLAWAFWLTGRWRNRSVFEWPIWGVVLTAAVAVGVMVHDIVTHGWASGYWRVGVGVLLALGATVVAWVCARCKARRGEKDTAFPSEDTRRVYEVDRQRNFLSTQLKFALVTTAGLLAFALVDSLGQTLYLLGHRPTSDLFAYLASALGVLASAVAFAQRIATGLAGKANGGRMRLPVAALVTAAALAVTLLLLVSLSVVTHAVVWRFEAPAGAPGITWATPTPARAVVNVRIPETRDGAVTATAEVAVPGASQPRPACAPCRGYDDLQYLGLVCAILFVFGLAFGRCWPFINQSSLHSMYSARLTRAYLGASNPRRRLGNERVTEVVPGDNIDPSDYWPGPDAGGVRTRPLHLINVTVNETVDGRSNVQRQDRKGTGLAVGPCAFSVGIRHHAVFPSHEVFRADRRAAGEGVAVFPTAAGPGMPPIYQVFAGDRWRGGEPLSVGAWTGISGAAFSTGLGARTSLGLSLLCGLTNVRLGYWWQSGANPARRPGRIRRRSFLGMFPVQSFLLSEFLSRFYGTTRWHWYLSDGGHFENMGGYELIRRRLKRIVLVDAEADPEYTFDGLANLVRKARVDFGAEIEFLREDELKDEVPDPYRRLFGTLAQLRRGKWNEEPVMERLPRPPERRRLSVEEPIDQARHSLAHAALARVRFIDDPEWKGWLLYLKPTLIGDEPTDLVQYHGAHPAFPQETTADQFFDEAQWESYRMLGYHIARDVFAPAPPDLAPGATSPADRMFGS